MCPPECRTVTIHVDVFGRAHRPSPTVNTAPADNHYKESAKIRGAIRVIRVS